MSTTLKRKKRKRPEPTWDLVYKRNFIEQMKREKFPMDIVDELPELIDMGYEAVPEEDIVRLNWWGLTMDNTADQMRGIGKVAVEYGKNYSELTTRQGIQLHWVRLDQLPEVLELIQETGLTTVGGEGDTVRNITGCPVAGISKEELFDVRPLIDEAADYFYGNPEYSNLPRKHKFTIASCPHQCNAPEIHDVALVAAEKDGRRGYALLHAAPLPGHRRLRPGGRRHRGAPGGHRRLAGGSQVPDQPGQGPNQVHGGRSRSRGRPEHDRGPPGL